MIDRSHIQKFQSCKGYSPSPISVQVLRNNISTYIPLAEYLIEKYCITDIDDLKFCIQDFVNSIFNSCSSSTYIDSKLYELQAIGAILKNPSIIAEEYEKAKDMPNTHTVYTANSARSKRLVLVNAIDEISIIEDFAKKHGITKNTNPKSIFVSTNIAPTLEELAEFAKKRGISGNPNQQVIHISISENTTGKEMLDFISLAIDILKQNNMYSKILLMLEKEKEQCENSIKDNQIASLQSFYDFMNAFNLLDFYLSSYKATSRKFGFTELTYSLSTGESSRDLLGLKELFSEDFLRTLPIKDLCYLHAFWCNRFAKETANMSTAFSAIDSLGLWKSIFAGQTEFYLSDEELIASLQKHKYISGLLGDTFSMCQNTVIAREIKEGNSFNGIIERDYTSFYRQLHNSIHQDYSNYFSRYLHGSNDFFEDVTFLAPFVKLQMHSYFKKDTTLAPLIKGLLDNPNLKNWGIIRQELVNGKLVDSIDLNNPKVLLSFDIEGFNMPFRLHVIKNDLIDLCRLANGTSLIPEYQGAGDFIVNNELITSNIIMPIPKRHRATIKQHSKAEIPNKNLWEHFHFLMNGKVPTQLTQTIVSKKQTIAVRKPIIYTDLKTGKRYTKNNNNFLEVDDENAR